jgi:hypothetical protein
LTTLNVCAHAGFGPIRASQTTGSVVSHLTEEHQTHFVTVTAAPCTSLFKPIWLDTDLPDPGPVPSGTYDAATLFWRHEALHRATLREYAVRSALYQSERDALEHGFIEGALARRDGSSADRTAYSARCFAEADAAEAGWLKRVLAQRVASRSGPLYTMAWRRFNRAARLPDAEGKRA